MRVDKHSRARLSGTARNRGIALIVVLWVAVILGLLAAGIGRIARDDVILARNLIEATQAELAADSAVTYALHSIASGGLEAWRVDGSIYAWRFAGAEVRIALTDEFGRIDINAAPAALLAALFAAAGTPESEASDLAEAVVAYRADDAEPSAGLREDASSLRFSSKFTMTEKLLDVPGMTPGLFERVAQAITVYTGGTAPRTHQAGPLVRAAVDGRVLSDAELDTVLLDTDEPFDADEPLEERPRILREGAEPVQRLPRLLRIHAEARTAGGSIFVREAVMSLPGRRTAGSSQIRLWQRGKRRFY